jgi:hypothetical protein
MQFYYGLMNLVKALVRGNQFRKIWLLFKRHFHLLILRICKLLILLIICLVISMSSNRHSQNPLLHRVLSSLSQIKDRSNEISV